MSLNYKAKRSGMKGFFLFHAEKVLLVLAFVALGTFFFLGYSGESLEDSKTPTALKSQVEQVKNKLTLDTWTNVEQSPERKVQIDHQQRAFVARNPVSEQYYPNPVLQTPLFKELVLRTDPELFPPEQIEVAVAIGAVAQRLAPRSKWTDPLEEQAVDPEIEAPKKPRSSRNRTPGPYGSEGLGSSGEMMPGGYPYGSLDGTDPNAPTVKKLTPYLQQKFQKEYYTIPGPAKLTGTNVVAVKAIVPMKRQRDEFERTFKDASGFDPLRDSPEAVFFEAERAEVRPGMDESDLVWEWVSQTDTAREQARQAASRPQEPADPRYLVNNILTFPIPPIVMVKLKDLGLHSLVPARRTGPRRPGEPRLGPDGQPLPEDAATAAGEEGAEGEGPRRGPQPVRRGPGALPVPGGPGASPYGASPYGASPYGPEAYSAESGMYPSEYGEMAGSESGMYPSEYGASPYGGSPYGAPIADVDYKLVRFFDFTAKPGKTYRYRVRLYYRDPNNIHAIRSGAGAPGAATAAAAAAASVSGSPYGAGSEMTETMPSYSEGSSSYSGSAYGYSGTGTGGELKEYMLHPDVLTRLTALDEETDGGAADTYWRTTDWSVPSADVVVPFAPEKRFAGEGESDRRISIASGGDFPSPMTEAHAKFAVSVWNPDLAVDVPCEFDAKRGTVLNKVGAVDVLHPLLLSMSGLGGSMGGEMGYSSSPYGPGGSPYGETVDPYAQVDPYQTPGAAGADAPKSSIRRLENFDFRSNSVVLDIRGGDKLPGSNPRSQMTSPTLALVVDQFGNLEFASEVQDAEGFRDTLFIDPTPEKMLEEQRKAQEAAAAQSGAMQSVGPGMVGP